jgi:hypothetical protein
MATDAYPHHPTRPRWNLRGAGGPGDTLVAVVRILLPSCCLAAGCGFGSPAVNPGDGPATDAPTTDGVTVDSPTVTCLERWRNGSIAFGSPTHLAVLGDSDVDRDPYLTPDELTIYFSTIRAGTQSTDVYAATRSSITATFGAPQRQGNISSADPDTRVSMTANELTAAVASSRAGTVGNSDVWISTRANKGAPFIGFLQTGLGDVNTGGDEHDPELSADGLHLYLAIGSPQRIVMSAWNSGASRFNAPQQLDELFSDTGDADPALSPDELVIVFTSRRNQGGGDSSGDLWYATRAAKTDPFAAPKRVPTLNVASFYDGDPALSPDGCRLYFASDRGGDFELYAAEATP